MKEDVIFSANPNQGHQKAGSSKILELHGSIIKIKCTVCEFKDEMINEFYDIPPLCKCGNILRPDVVWFGESLPQDIWKNAIILASQCDLMVIVGTSLVVSPANTLPIYAKQNNATLIEINPEKTEMSSEMNLVLRNISEKTLPEFVSLFK